MHLVILDFHGTLDTVPDPIAFVERLKARGYMPVILSGSDSKEISSRYPGLVEAVREVFQKPCALPEITAMLKEVFSAVTLVDDDANMEIFMKRACRACPETWTYLPAEKLMELA